MISRAAQQMILEAPYMNKPANDNGGVPDLQACGLSGYHKFIGETGREFGSFEIFWYLGNRKDDPDRGWYWQAGFPGGLSDGDAYGPFLTSQDAYMDAQGVNQ